MTSEDGPTTVDERITTRLVELGTIFWLEHRDRYRALDAYTAAGAKGKLRDLGGFYLRLWERRFEHGPLDWQQRNAYLAERSADLDFAYEAYVAAGAEDRLLEVGHTALRGDKADLAMKAFAAVGAKDKLLEVGALCLERREIDVALKAFAAADQPLTPEQLVQYGDRVGGKEALAAYRAASAWKQLVALGDRFLKEEDFDSARIAFSESRSRERLLAVSDMCRTRLRALSHQSRDDEERRRMIQIIADCLMTVVAWDRSSSSPVRCPEDVRMRLIDLGRTSFQHAFEAYRAAGAKWMLLNRGDYHLVMHEYDDAVRAYVAGLRA